MKSTTRNILLFILSFKCAISFGQQKGIVSNTIREVRRMIDTSRGQHNVYVLKVRAADSMNYCVSVWYIVRSEEFPVPDKKYVLALDGQYLILDVPEFLYSKIATAYRVFPFDDRSKQSLRKKLATDGSVNLLEYGSAIVSCYTSNTYLTKYYPDANVIPQGITPYNAREMFKDRLEPSKMDTISVKRYNVN